MSGSLPEHECVKLFRDTVLASYLPDILKSINERPKAREVCSAILSLLNDVHVRPIRTFAEAGINAEQLLQFTYPVAWSIVMKPCVDHLYGAFMMGCLPLCFQPIRIVLEAIVESYYVDISYYEEEKDPFTRLKEFNNEQIRQIGMSKFLKDFFLPR